MIYFRILIVFVFCISTGRVFAQPNYVSSSNLFPILKNQDTLSNSWSGGINTAIFSTLDVDNDGQDDLFVMDRMHDRGVVFLKKNGKYIYSSSLTTQLPPLQKYALAYDYNKDGKKDLFTATALGIKAFKNISDKNGLRFEIVAEPILTYYAPTYSNMNITMNDIPSFSDVDNDGDMDILHFNSASGTSVVWERNMSIEKYGRPDSLDFKQTDDCWGGFQEQQCKTYYFGYNCKNNFRTEHVGAGAVLAFDSDNDSDKDILIGKEDCTNLNFLENKGTLNSAFFNKLISSYPNSKPAEPILYPISFYEDVDFDEMKDLIISTGSPALNTDLSKNTWWYKNTGTNTVPIFTYQSNDFLQNTMIDLGQNTHPAFADKDGDGDLDMFVSNSTNQTGIGASIFYFENTGDISNPSFALRDSNYLNLGGSLYSEIAISFSDLNNDGNTDLIAVAQKNNAISTSIYYNQSNLGLTLGNAVPLTITLTEMVGIQFYDLDNDLLKDVLLGNNAGNIIHYKNTGTISSPIFSVVTNTFGAIENTGTNSTIAISDIDSDSKPDLIYTNDTDSVWYYSDFKNQTTPFLGQTLNSTLPLGFKLSLAMADLNNDQKPEMVFGNDNGGLQLFVDEDVLSYLDQSESVNSAFHFFPNPNNGNFEIQTSKSGEIQIKDLFGKLLFTKYLEANQKSNLELNLEKGIYMVSFERSETKKMIINR